MVDPFTAISAIIMGVKAARWIFKKITGEKKKEDEIRNAEALAEKMQNTVAALDAHHEWALFHVGSYAKRDGTCPYSFVLTL
jgi:hypothetical protein